ncbi:hypothetical protein SAMN02745216_02680 [Desulfatibacillum alkenivorans DSM 16219]|jgi:hypothetical protein|uniref:Uncharacterized protein n=1 Tax=Desulfatibacillum alkenivorans DSM 16219 TaxID=1121393 RepID=A0A1M6NWB4_9BACT|nr:hypothetical protein SAMN02745216_02680 [Desulfatibacillum alkenivorans DSM 16219]
MTLIYDVKLKIGKGFQRSEKFYAETGKNRIGWLLRAEKELNGEFLDDFFQLGQLFFGAFLSGADHNLF